MFCLYFGLIKYKQGTSWPFRSSLTRVHTYLKKKLVGRPKLQNIYQLTFACLNRFDSPWCDMKVALY